MKQYTSMVRVMESTYDDLKGKKVFIGKELEVYIISFSDNTVAVYNEDKTDFFWFNLTDVRFLTPVSFKGNRVAIGDKVKYFDEWYKVTEFYKYNGIYRITIETQNEETNLLTQEDIQAHDFNQTKETITIGGKVFDKHEFEECVKNLKEIK